MRFWKLSGAGNHFLAFAAPSAAPDPELVRLICRHGIGIGADGVLFLSRRAGVTRMTYWNADGQRADLCLNGSRCAARLAFHLGWAERSLELLTDVGVLRAMPEGQTGIRIATPSPRVLANHRVELANGPLIDGTFVDSGVPHLVVDMQCLADQPIDGLGPALRHHHEFAPAGCNVTFLRTAGELEIRTWERGVEGETLACGTGVLAAAAVLQKRQGGRCFGVRTAGGYVLTTRVENGAWSLSGDARIVARGEILPEALALP